MSKLFKRLRAYVQARKDIQPFTWKAHFLVSFAGTFVVAGGLAFTGLPWDWCVLAGSLAMAGVYTVHERMDERKHKADGTWLEVKGGATARADKAGDLLAAYVWAIACMYTALRGLF